jgi:uncharacterized protein (TIGR00288 family)
MDVKASNENRFALLIDADNVSARYVKPILDELSKYGTITVKRIYGDWTLTMHAKWKDVLLENSITPIQQFGYTQGKNATDSAMIIDAMDLLYGKLLDGFCIVSSDSDFTRLASRLRESGKMVIGMGEKKTPTPFRRACDVFTTLEVISGSDKVADSSMSKEDVEQAVVDIITENLNNGKATGLGEVGSRMLKRYPDFDVRSFGTNLLSKLLGEFTRVKITKDGSNVAVELADGTHAPGESEGVPDVSEAADALPASPAEPEDAEGVTGDGAAVEAEPEPEAPAEEDAAGAGETKPRKRRSRGGRGRKSKRALADAAHAGADDAQADAQTPTESADAHLDTEASPKPKQTRTRKNSAKAKSAEASPADNKADIYKQYIRQLIKEAGPRGISLSQLGSDVRAEFKDFKVRDLGFAQIRYYVASVHDFEIFKEGRIVLVRMR